VHHERRQAQDEVHRQFPCELPIVSPRVFLLCHPHVFAVDLFRDSVTAVGGTTHIPEVAVGFSGGGFSDIVRCYVSFRQCNDGLDKEMFSSSHARSGKMPPWGNFSNRCPAAPMRDFLTPKDAYEKHYMSLGSEGETHGIFALTLCIGDPGRLGPSE
jgi:hypothetical protein